MVYADWDFFSTGPAGGGVLTSSAGGTPLAGSASVRLWNQATIPNTPPRLNGVYAQLEAPVPNRATLQGRLRTLVRVHAANGTGRQQVGLAVQGYSGADRNQRGGYVFLLDGPQGLGSWEQLVLAYIQDVLSSVPLFLITEPYVVLASVPLSTGAAQLTALELTWKLSTGGADTRVRLIGKAGSQPDYSDLTTRLHWESTGYPAPVQSGTGESGIVIRYHGVTATPVHQLDVLCDQTILERITTETVAP
jgi:hypothetical protein